MNKSKTRFGTPPPGGRTALRGVVLVEARAVLAQMSQAMATGSSGALSIMVQRPNSPVPLAFTPTPTSTIVFNISGNGATGDAKFDGIESTVTMDDIDINSQEKPHGKKVSGSLSWTCAHVDRLNPEMNEAVDGMFNGLMRNH